MKNFFIKIKKFIYLAENYEISLINFIILFFSICFVRNFLEGLLEYPKIITTNIDVKIAIMQIGCLFNLEWITLFFYIIIIVYLLTKSNIISIFKITLLFFCIIIIVPLIDFIIYYPNGCKIDYLYTLKDYLNALFYFFIPFVDVKVCPGIRIEVFLSVILLFFYILIKTNNISKSFLGIMLLYFLAISSMAFPVFILIVFYPFNTNLFDTYVNNFFFSPCFLDSFLNKFSIMIFILLIPALLIIYKVYFKNKKFALLIKNLLSLNSIIIFIIIFLGFISGYGIINLFSNVFNIIFICFLFAISSILNLYFQKNQNKNIKVILFFLLLLFSLCISFNHLLILLFIFSIWYIYNNFYFLLNNNFFKYLNILLLFIVLYIFGYIISSSEIKTNFINIITIFLFSLIYYYKQKKHGNI